MTKSLLTILAIALLGAVSTDAKTVKVPNDDFAIASIAIPYSWKLETITNGVTVEIDAKAVYLSVVAVRREKGM